MKLGTVEFRILKNLVKGRKIVREPNGNLRWADRKEEPSITFSGYIIERLIGKKILARTSGGDIFITVPGMMVFEAAKAQR